MWGLIYKDIVSSRFSYIMAAVVSLLAPWFTFLMALTFYSEGGGDEEFQLIISGMTAVLMTMGWMDAVTPLIKADEKKICSAWFMSTPAGAKNLVLSKYAGGLLISVAVINLSSLYVQIPQMVIYKLTGNHTGESVTGIMILLFSFLIIAWALEMPFCFRFSTKYGSYIRTALVIVLFTALAIYGLFFAPDNMLDPIFEFFLSEEKSTGYYFFMNGIPLISLLLYYISYRISCRAYLKGAEELG